MVARGRETAAGGGLKAVRKLARFLAVYLGLSAFLGGVFVVLSWPNLPSTQAQWLAAFLLALPIQIAGELLGSCLWENKLARFVDDATAHKSLSLLRIGYGVFALLLFIGVIFAAAYGWRLARQLLAG